MTSSGYWPRQSHAHATFDRNMSSVANDFRLLTPLVLAAAIRQADTTVCEPVHRFHLEAPADAVAGLTRLLSEAGALVDSREPIDADRSVAVRGLVPAASVPVIGRLLPGLTNGDGFIESAFDCYRPVTGQAPDRERAVPDPYDRANYLRHITGRA